MEKLWNFDSEEPNEQLIFLIKIVLSSNIYTDKIFLHVCVNNYFINIISLMRCSFFAEMLRELHYSHEYMNIYESNLYLPTFLCLCFASFKVDFY